MRYSLSTLRYTRWGTFYQHWGIQDEVQFINTEIYKMRYSLSTLRFSRWGTVYQHWGLEDGVEFPTLGFAKSWRIQIQNLLVLTQPNLLIWTQKWAQYRSVKIQVMPILLKLSREARHALCHIQPLPVNEKSKGNRHTTWTSLVIYKSSDKQNVMWMYMQWNVQKW